MHRQTITADGAADAIASVYTVLIVQRNRLEGLRVKEKQRSYITINCLTKGFARVVIHPTNFVHVFRREAHLGNPIFLEHCGNGFRETGIHVHMLVTVNIGRDMTNKSNKTIDLGERRAKRITCDRNSVITSSTHIVPSHSAAINPSFPRN